MVSIKALDAVTPADLWREVPLEEEFWEEARERQRRLLKVLIEGALEEEQVELLAAGRLRSAPACLQSAKGDLDPRSEPLAGC